MRARGTLMIAAGGTGGHVYPAMALAEALLRRDHDVALVTDRRGAGFAKLNPKITQHRVPAGRLGGGPLGAIKGALGILAGIRATGRLLRESNVEVMIGFGGYPSVPPMVAARRAGMTTILHEQNAMLGRANRMLAGHADMMALSFAQTERLPIGSEDKSQLVGNPVRAEIAALADTPFVMPSADGPINILVTGGSQGASVFATVVPDAIAALPAHVRARLRITQQCRAEDLENVQARYETLNVPAELAAFLDGMAVRLSTTHLVICRAGASTVAELTTAGRPAVLVPYPHAADDHQTANARAIDAGGGGWLMPQNDLTAGALAGLIAGLAETPDRLVFAADAARRLGHPHAAERLADLVEQVVTRKNKSVAEPNSPPVAVEDDNRQLYGAAE
ncbi:MAG: undecaprenyldiphospho-muramoylpentapeptide beta-N-acetylglucosaminyltransferase [Alphaproteobacteria bacterium]